MVSFKIPVVVECVDMVIDVLKNIMGNANFKEDASDDYKEGFFDFGNAVVETLEKLKKSGE